jgi:hypothetical protein
LHLAAVEDVDEKETLEQCWSRALVAVEEDVEEEILELL